MFQPIGLAANRIVERIAIARNRDAARVARAAELARANGGNALDAAVAATQAAFDRTAQITELKLKVLDAIGYGAGHPRNVARYGKRLALISERLDHWKRTNEFARIAFNFTVESRPDIALILAINQVEFWYREERRALRYAAALGRGSALSLAVLEEMRLMLRLFRRSQYRDHLAGLIGFALGEAA